MAYVNTHLNTIFFATPQYHIEKTKKERKNRKGGRGGRGRDGGRERVEEKGERETGRAIGEERERKAKLITLSRVCVCV